MSVVKRKRKESPFEVFHHLTKMRKDITDLLLRDFGYSNEKFQKKMERWYGGRPPDQLTDTQKKNIERQKRRIHQDLAIGQCYRLVQELQYSIETLPVDINVYLRFSEQIQKEVGLIKGWRKSDNKFKR